jgi:hypothetical protein
LGDPDKPMKKSKKDDDDDLSDEEFMKKYKGKDLGWDAPTNKKLERMRSIRNKKRGGMNEGLFPNDFTKSKVLQNKDLSDGVKKRIIDTEEKAIKYTKGTKHSATNLIRFYIDKGHPVLMYVKGPKRLFIDTETGKIFNEIDQYLAKADYLENFDKYAIEYLNGNEDIFVVNNFASSKPKPRKTFFVNKYIETMEDAIKYTKGTKVSAERLYDMVKDGDTIQVAINPGNNKRIFVSHKTGEVYNQLDRYMGNFKKEDLKNELEDYLHS